MGKVIQLDFRTEFQKVVDNFENEMPTQIKLIQLQAHLAHVQYAALVKQGFTNEQALAIVLETPSWK